MKQIEYTEKQKIVLEVLDEVEKLFKPSTREVCYDIKLQEYFNKIQKIKNIYDIKEKYETLREFIDKREDGAYHKFIFEIYNVKMHCTSVSDFASIYNVNLLNKYYVLKDTAESSGHDCTNYTCEHNLEIVSIEEY